MTGTPEVAVELDAAMRERFRREGYLHLPAAVPGDLWRRALRAVNASLGRGIDPAQVTTYSAQSYCPEVKGTPAIGDLFNASAIAPIAGQLIGPGRVRPVSSGQIALRFPVDAGAQPKQPVAHIDGMYTPTNGVPKGSISNFTALAGVFLSDVPGDFCGNFVVWPGSHLKHAEYFRERGAESLLAGMPPVDLGPPVQVTARAGDAVIAHYLLGHGIAQNTSPHIRYACFFRLKSIEHDDHKWESMANPWLDWHGLPGSE